MRENDGQDRQRWDLPGRSVGWWGRLKRNFLVLNTTFRVLCDPLVTAGPPASGALETLELQACGPRPPGAASGVVTCRGDEFLRGVSLFFSGPTCYLLPLGPQKSPLWLPLGWQAESMLAKGRSRSPEPGSAGGLPRVCRAALGAPRHPPATQQPPRRLPPLGSTASDSGICANLMS